MISQDRLGRRVYQVSQVGLEPRDSQEDLVSPEPRANPAPLELDHLDNLDPRYKDTHPLKFLTLEKPHSAKSRVHTLLFIYLFIHLS